MPEFKTREEYEKWKTGKAKEAKEKAVPVVEPQKESPLPDPKPTEKKCSHCAMMIPIEARICPHCRKDLRLMTTPVKIFLVLLAVSILTALLIGKPAQQLAPQEQDRRYEACIFSRELVQEFLKAPSTAKFGECEGLKNTDGRFIIVSYVDAQNSFGAMIRSKYAWHGRYADKIWDTDYFAFDGKIVINNYKD